MHPLLIEKRDGTLLVTLNRPEKLNALNLETLRALDHLLENLDGPLVLTGSGTKAFSAGADVKEMQAMTAEEIEAFIRLGLGVAAKLEKVPYPTLAAVQGYALGGGLEMALACDFIFAAETAKFGLPEITLNLIPGFGGVQRLADAVGKRRAKEIMMSGRPITAPEALRLGLINRIVEDPLAAALESARAFASFSPRALAALKAVLEKGEDPVQAFIACHEEMR